MVDGSFNSVNQNVSIGSNKSQPITMVPVSCDGDINLDEKSKKKFDREKQLDYLTDQLAFFDERMHYENAGYFDENEEIYDPSAEDIGAYSKYVTIASKMENETPVIALVYIERIL